MGNKFSMNDLLNSQSKPAQEKAGGGFVIKNIPIEKIVPSESNKYGIRDILELADNIEAVGLMHNLLVKQPDAAGLYEIISGERRFRACKMLYDGGNKKYATVPCKVEDSEDTALSELKLIYANATSRELTDYEKTYQAIRIKELMLELKAKGFKFTGRMRDIVAGILDVSPAQMGRMESINEHLTPAFKEEFKEGSIGITTAYELSTLPEPAQAAALEEYKATGAAAVKDVKKKTAPKAPDSKADELLTKLAETNIDCAGMPEPVMGEAQPRSVLTASVPETRNPNRMETIRVLRAVADNIIRGQGTVIFDLYEICLDAAFLLDGEA